MPTNDGFSGVSNCYVFKSRLQEYAQKVGLPTPVYETIKEGPSHEPSFRSAVIVNDVRYESLPGFFNRKAAEQSAAEVALVELAKRGEVSECISQPVHETGLCKNLLQEYAQKMNYAIPMYQCRKDEAPGRVPHFSCTVEIGGIQYIGAAARTKKEAEIKAARTALLAIQSSASELSGKPVGNSQLTVVPCRKRGIELANKLEVEETVNVPKAKKARFKKKMLKKLSGEKTCNAHVQGTGNLVKVATNLEGLKMGQTNASEFPEPLSAEATRNCREGRLDIEPVEGEISAMTCLSIHIAGDSPNGHSTAAHFNQSVQEAPKLETSSLSYGDVIDVAKEVNEVTRNSTAADSDQNVHKTLNVVNPSMSYGDVTDMGKEVNDATVRSTAANSDLSDYKGLNVVISSMPYGPVITSAKEVNEAGGQSRVANSNQSSFKAPTTVTSCVSRGDITISAKEVNEATGVGELSPTVNNPVMGQMESSCVIPGINQQEEMIQASMSRAIGSQ